MGVFKQLDIVRQEGELLTFTVNGKLVFVCHTFDADGKLVRTQLAYVHPEKGFVFRDSEENGGGEE